MCSHGALCKCSQNLRSCWYGCGLLAADHGQEHLKSLCRLEGMGVTGGHDNAVAGFEEIGLSVNAYFDLAVEDLDEGVKIGGVFGKSLSFVEGEKGDIPDLVLGDLFADDASVGVVY